MARTERAVSPAGVVVRLEDLGNGRSKVVLDDVLAAGSGEPKRWEFECFYTSHEFDSGLVGEMALPTSDYQRLGEVLMARLLALNGRVK